MTTTYAPNSSAKPPAWLCPCIAAAAVFMLVYGVELSSFTLSIDEEAATFKTTTATAWLSQGRWGMGLVTWLLPNFEAIPLLSTTLFGVGLLFATMRGVIDFRLAGSQAYFYAVVHAGFPLWLHIAQFNTFAAGFGFGIAAAAYGANLAVRANSVGERLISVVLLAFAVSIYQTVAVYAALYALLVLHAEIDAVLPSGMKQIRRRLSAGILHALGLFAAALTVYLLTQRLSMKIADVEIAYVDAYWHMDRLRSDPAETLFVSMRSLAEYLTGRQQVYLGWGAGVLFLTWLGLLPIFLLSNDRDSHAADRLLLSWLVVILGIVAIGIPFLLSAGTLPIRSHVAWPLLAAWLASRIVVPPGSRWRAACVVGLAYYSVVVCSIGASLFYTERLVRDADAALTQRLVPAIYEAATATSNTAVRFTLVGQWSFPVEGQIQRAGVFGTSFYEHDGGNVRRVAFYMKTLGIHDVDPVWLGNRPDLIPSARSMPIWPAPGSVRQVNGVVIVKLGQPTPQQLSAG